MLPGGERLRTGAQIASAVVEGVMLGLYKFDKFFKKEKDKPFRVDNVIIIDDGEIAFTDLPYPTK